METQPSKDMEALGEESNSRMEDDIGSNKTQESSMTDAEVGSSLYPHLFR